MRISPLLAAPLALAACSAPKLDAGARYIQFKPEGELALSSGMIDSANKLDEIGLGDDEGTIGVAVDFKWGMPHLTINTQATDWSGTGTLQAELSAGGVTIPIGSTVDSNLDLGISNALLTWDLAPTDLEIGIGLGVALLDIQADFTDTTGSAGTVDFDETVPIPLLAARLGFDIGPLDFTGYIAGLSAKVDDDEATYFDVDANLRWPIVGGDDRLSGAVTLGWRQLEVDIEVNDDDENADGNMTFSGPYAGFTLSF